LHSRNISLIPILAGVFFAADDQTVVVTILPQIMSDLRVEITELHRAAWTVTGYLLGYVSIMPVMGGISDIIGRRTIYTWALIIFSLGSIGTALTGSLNPLLEWQILSDISATESLVKTTTTLEWVVITRIIQAIGAGALVPISIAMIGDLYSGVQETTAQGIRTAGINVGIIGVPILSGILFVYSWRYPFLLYLIAVPVAIWAWYVIPQSTQSASSSIRDYINELVLFVSKPRMACLVTTFVIRFLLLFGFLTYISVLAIGEAGLDVKAAGLLVAIKGIVSFVSSTQVGRLSNKFSTINMIIGGFFVGSLGIIIMGVVPAPIVIAIGAVLYGFGDGIVSPGQKSLVNQLAPEGMRGGAVSVATTFQNLGKVVGPGMIALMLIVSNISMAFTIVGLTGLLAGVGLMIGVKKLQ